MKRSWSNLWTATFTLAGLVLMAGCDELPANFWANKWGEIVNRSIFGAINAILGIVTGGTVQI